MTSPVRPKPGLVHYAPTEAPALTAKLCGEAIAATAPEARQIVISAITLDGPLMQIGTVQTLAELLGKIREDVADACDPQVFAPNKHKPSQMNALDYWITPDGSGYRVTLRWPDTSEAHGFFTLPVDNS